MTLHAENPPVIAHNQVTPFQKLKRALEVAAAVHGTEAAFPEKEEKTQENPLAVAFDSFYFCFCWFLVFFRYSEELTVVTSSMRDEGEGNGGFVCGTLGKWRCSCAALLKAEDHFH